QTSTSLKCVLNKNAEIKYSISGRSGANIMLSFSLPSNIGKNRIKINLYDISGRFMHSANVEDSYQNQRANIPGIHSGIYLVRLFSGNKQIKGSDACVVIK
ncbi:MAG TPA: T9SS type A sorting domain-containing protein, partial [Chitinispirillaceae bacterium]|nr:T9SS type A sorting domain-containing protein [Chitinispirillaceae bacterium]